MSLANHEAKEIWYESAGTRLFAADCGSGIPIVFLHGGFADHRASSFRLGELRATHRVITPDVRAAGRSIYAGALSWPQHAADVLALLEHLGIERAVIGGISAGAGIALKFAELHPAHTLALVLATPAYAGEERGLTPAQRHAFARMCAAAEQAESAGIAAIFPLFEALPAPIREVALAMASSFDPASVASTARFLATTQPFARTGELEELKVPTLVVPGTDPEHPVEVAELYARTLPNARLAEPGAELGGTVARFLRELAL